MSRHRKKKGRPISGWVALDKPVGIGSTECVSKIKRLYKAAKAGHAGTLDPLASGMLPIALGEATKTVPYVMDSAKTYLFTVAWGSETQTDDREGEITAFSDRRPTEQEIRDALPDYVGEIEQIPPAFSAVKIDGERAYKRARGGETVTIDPRPVTISYLELVECDSKDEAVFECQCGKGTYVRSLARDLGRQLGCHGHVSQLRRIAVGPFAEDDLISLDKLEDLDGALDSLDAELLPTGAVLEDLPEISVDRDQANKIRAGNAILLRGRDAVTFADEAVCVSGGQLIAIGEVSKGTFQPKRVFRVSRA